MPPLFEIETSTQDDLSIVSLAGHVDAHSAPRFEEAIGAELAAGRRRIIVDCARLSYISSAGLGVFMGFIEEIRERGGDIKLCGAAAQVRATFEVVGFQEIFDILPDVPGAVQRFRESPVRKG